MIALSEGFNFCVGPIHPALKEPIQLDFKVEGERVKDVSFKLGQVHRGIEWAGTRRNPLQILYLAERVCGICNICHPLTYCMAVEDAARMSVPERAQYLRVIYAELERIHSHLLWVGVAAHELGFDSVLHYTWKVREKVLDTIEYLTGNRITKAIMMIGGVRRDISKEQVPKVRETLEYYKEGFGKLGDIFLKDSSVKARTRDVGIMTKKEALEYCAVGPTARASGVKKDVRQDFPYAAYSNLKVKAITPDVLTGEVHGDVYDRIVVRLLEVKQSVELIEKCLDEMPEGPIQTTPVLQKLLVDLKEVKADGIAISEAPRGELVHFVKMVGEESPYAWKIRAPTYANIITLKPILRDCQIADISISAASIDPCMSCMNRAIIADKNKILGMEELRELGVKKAREMGVVKNA